MTRPPREPTPAQEPGSNCNRGPSMTQRERQASGGLAAPASAPGSAGAPPGPAAPVRPAPGPETASRPASLWEDYYRSASPDEQAALLALAGRQGILYAHTLPPPGNGSRPRPPREDT